MSMFSNDHLEWLVDTGQRIKSVCGKDIAVFTFSSDLANEALMTRWATHFRNHYCLDTEIDDLKSPGLSKEQYLLNEKFPHGSISPGPSIRAGDFSEILVSDYLQFVKNYQVPRTRYERKMIANESSKGSDILAFKKRDDAISDDDELLIFEVKARASENVKSTALQDAISDSVKDEIRVAESLNAMKQRLYDKRDFNGYHLIGRFQREADHPFRRSYGAAAVLSSSSFKQDIVAGSSTLGHPNRDALDLIVIHSAELMSLVHELYRRAANEA